MSRLDDGRLLEAALGMAPQYVRAEVGRLLPQLGAGEPGPGSRGEGWQRERLFSGGGGAAGRGGRAVWAWRGDRGCALGGQCDAGLPDLPGAGRPQGCADPGGDVPQR